MKLVEILANELGEWPEGAAIVVQDIDKEVKFDETGEAVCQATGVWIRGGRQDFANLLLSELAIDHATAIVTREMWEAERAKVQQVEWNGEGLPPVGAVCETALESSDATWIECRIVAHAVSHGTSFAIAQMDDRFNYSAHACHFRPVPTDREKWIAAAKEASKNYYGELTLGKIYDAGLGKLPEDEVQV